MINLDDYTAQHHILSIRLAPDGFSFFILNVLDHSIVDFNTIDVGEHQDVSLIALHAMRTNDVFSYAFKEVRLLLDTPHATVVPNDVYQEDQKEALFSFNIDLAKNEYVLVNSSEVYSVKVLFSIQKELYAFFTKHFSSIRIIHNVALLLNQAYNCPDRAQEQLFIAYSRQHLTVIGLRNHSFVFHNCFNLVTGDDLIYYFLLVIQDLGFDQYESSAVFSGVLPAEVDELLVIRQYLANLDFMGLPQQYNYSDDVKDMPSHYFANFFALPSCE